MAIDKAALQRQHPEWNIVDAIPATDGSGGIWALGRDGAVFALDAQGNAAPGAATFFGSYTQLDPGQRQGDRYFVSIQSDPTTGGYTLISNQPGQQYTFRGNKPIGQAAVTGPAEAGAPPPNPDAQLNQLTAALKEHGLEDLATVAWDYFTGDGGGDINAVLNWLPTTDQYNQRFPGLKELSAQGRAWTPGQWMNYEQTVLDTAGLYGLPPGFVDRADIGRFLANGVSADEVGQRIQTASDAVYKADPATIAFLRQNYGLGDGDLTAFFLEPDKAMPFIERKAQYEASKIGGAAAGAGYNISGDTALSLGDRGVSEAEARTGFGELAGQAGLWANTAEESMVGEDITQEEQIGAQFLSDPNATQEISSRRSRRAARFQGGGGSAGGARGKTGLG